MCACASPCVRAAASDKEMSLDSKWVAFARVRLIESAAMRTALDTAQY